MKRFLLSLMLLCLLAVPSYGIIVEADDADCQIEFVMLDSSGDPVTGLDGEDFTIYWWEPQDSAEQTYNCTGTAAADDLDDGYTAGFVHEIGHGVYRFDVPNDMLDGIGDDGDSAGTKVSLCITDETTAAKNTYVVLEISPPVNVQLVDGEVPGDTDDFVDALAGASTTDFTWQSLTIENPAGNALTLAATSGYCIDIDGGAAGSSAVRILGDSSDPTLAITNDDSAGVAVSISGGTGGDLVVGDDDITGLLRQIKSAIGGRF